MGLEHQLPQCSGRGAVLLSEGSCSGNKALMVMTRPAEAWLAVSESLAVQILPKHCSIMSSIRICICICVGICIPSASFVPYQWHSAMSGAADCAAMACCCCLSGDAGCCAVRCVFMRLHQTTRQLDRTSNSRSTITTAPHSPLYHPQLSAGLFTVGGSLHWPLPWPTGCSLPLGCSGVKLGTIRPASGPGACSCCCCCRSCCCCCWWWWWCSCCCLCARPRQQPLSSVLSSTAAASSTLTIWLQAAPVPSIAGVLQAEWGRAYQGPAADGRSLPPGADGMVHDVQHMEASCNLTSSLLLLGSLLLWRHCLTSLPG